MNKKMLFGNFTKTVILTACLGTSAMTQAQSIIGTVAGNGTSGFSGDAGPATSAEISTPNSVIADGAGNYYISDEGNQRIRKVSSTGTITTVAGNGTAGNSGDGGPAISAEINHPSGVALDASGNLYISDYGNNRVRKVSTSGNITDFAGNGTAGYSGDGSAATSAELRHPYGLAFDGSGNLYIAEEQNHCIRRVTPAGIISTFAGTGTVSGFSGDGGAATAAKLSFPNCITFDASGNLYIMDNTNHRIRKINTSGIISTYAGNGTAGYTGDGGAATSAEFNFAAGLKVDASGTLYFSDGLNNVIRRINSSGTISTVAGTGVAGYSGDGGAPILAKINHPNDVAFDGTGILLIADLLNNRIRAIYKPEELPKFANITQTSSANGDEDLNVYPNPNHGSITINFASFSENITATITNVLGQKVQEINITGPKTEVQLDIPKGTYLLSVLSGNNIITRRVVVE